MDFEQQLTSAMRVSAGSLNPPVNRLVTGGLERGQRQRRRRMAVWGAAAGIVALLLAGGSVVVFAGDDDSPTTTTPATPVRACRSVVDPGVIPPWARDGFSDPQPQVPHVMSAKGDMVAILFGKLYSPPAEGINNKVLWVSRIGQDRFGPLVIDATLAGTNTHVRRKVDGGPGPSTIDVPQPGCWRMQLRWGTHRDTIDLAYESPGPSG